MTTSPYHLALTRRFAVPSEPFELRTSDGVDLVGSRLGGAGPAVVLCHGFSSWHRKARAARFASALAEWLTVYAFDFRGHGGSGGETTFGNLEVYDVEAVLGLARGGGHDPVATLGWSMGGVAAVRHAGLLGGADAVVAISTPARWNGHDTDAVRRMTWLAGTRRGRRIGRAFGVRIPESLTRPETPEEVAGKIAPAPLLVVHGRDDHFFDEEDSWRIYRRAGEPKALWLASRFGHGEDGLDPPLAGRIARWLYREWGLEWPG